MKFSIEYGVCRVDDSQVHIVPNKPDTVEADNLDAVIAILAAAKLPQLIGGLTIKELHIKTVVDNNITP